MLDKFVIQEEIFHFSNLQKIITVFSHNSHEMWEISFHFLSFLTSWNTTFNEAKKNLLIHRLYEERKRRKKYLIKQFSNCSEGEIYFYCGIIRLFAQQYTTELFKLPSQHFILTENNKYSFFVYQIYSI